MVTKKILKFFFKRILVNYCKYLLCKETNLNSKETTKEKRRSDSNLLLAPNVTCLQLQQMHFQSHSLNQNSNMAVNNNEKPTATCQQQQQLANTTTTTLTNTNMLSVSTSNNNRTKLMSSRVHPSLPNQMSLAHPLSSNTTLNGLDY